MLIFAFVACAKKDTNVCQTTMAEITGTYHLTKFESVSYQTGAAQNRTSSLTSCEVSGIYKFNIDSTVTYSELSNCNNSGNGVWWASKTSFYSLFASGVSNRIGGGAISITSWDCTNLVLITNYPAVDSNY
ncbi:MAG TPA: hypothetical protein VKT28_18315, partial [Puia sp.]|nr:hypothetical protein [Puia sp.]